MNYLFYALLVWAGYYTYDKLTGIRRFNSFFHYKCRYGKWRNFVFIKMKVRNILPYWAYRFGGGPVPNWSWRVILTLALLSPFWCLDWVGLQVNWSYFYSFVGGFVLGEIVSETLRSLAIKQFVQGTPEAQSAINNFISQNLPEKDGVPQ
ncbi:MAG: hypothetical protein Q8O98_00745 [bacterium]|nr:hypothetical protein [bacterium]